MKNHFSKVFIYPLIMASFFLFCFKVNAAEYNLNSTLTDFINSEYYNYVLEFSSNHAESNNFSHYIIKCDSNVSYIQVFFGTFTNSMYLYSNVNNTYSYKIPFTYSYYYEFTPARGYTPQKWNFGDTLLSANFTYNSTTFNHIVLYANFDIFVNQSNDISLIYNNNSYSLFSDNLKLYTLSDIVNGNFGSDPHEEEQNILLDFYTTIGSKITWLGEQLSSNYIYLSILGVFILIFLIELIRRYLL